MRSPRRKAPSVPASLQRSASASNRRFSLPENWRRLAIATTSGSRRAAASEAVSPAALRASSATASEEEPNDPFIEDFSNEVMCMSYLYSKLPETVVSPHIGTGGNQAKMAVGGTGGGWTETGTLDGLGHKLEALLVRQLDPEIDALSDRIGELLSAGWSRVRVVTDHGWLLLPGGLPKVELSPHLVATKWSRCAAVKGGSTPNIPTYPWYW